MDNTIKAVDFLMRYQLPIRPEHKTAQDKEDDKNDQTDDSKKDAGSSKGTISG